jgi:tetraacyldisaccharide 4'-kinase
LLWPFARLYQLITDLRNYLYDAKVFKSVSFEIPIISVGNLSVGGTGKTPHTEYLIQLLKYVYQVGTLSRGYGRKSHGFILADRDATAATIGDEPMIFHVKYHEATVAVAEERVIAIPRMLSANPALDVILLDDAFQHRRIRPGLSILLTEYDKLFTQDDVLPAGWLREGRGNYHRADIIIVTKCPADISEAEQERIRVEIKPFPYQHLYFSYIEYGATYEMFYNNQRPPQTIDITGKDILLLTGIASNQRLVKYLEQKANKVYETTYKDHHLFDEYDLENLRETLNHIKSDNKIIVTTEKDTVRLWPHRTWFLQNNIPIFVQPIRVAFAGNSGERFDADIIKYIEITRRKNIINQPTI